VVAVSTAAAVSLALIAGPSAAAAGFALMGALGLAPLLFRGGEDDEIIVDERDALIHAKASLTGFRIFWVLWVLGSVGMWAALRSREVVPVEVLPLTVLAGWALFTAIESAMTLVGYGTVE
jgi:uncharacterized membrane protein